MAGKGGKSYSLPVKKDLYEEVQAMAKAWNVGLGEATHRALTFQIGKMAEGRGSEDGIYLPLTGKTVGMTVKEAYEWGVRQGQVIEGMRPVGERLAKMAEELERKVS